MGIFLSLLVSDGFLLARESFELKLSNLFLHFIKNCFQYLFLVRTFKVVICHTWNRSLRSFEHYTFLDSESFHFLSLRKELLEVTADSGTWKKTWKCCLLGKLDRTNLIYRLDFWKHLSSFRSQVPLTQKSIRCFWESSQLFCNM